MRYFTITEMTQSDTAKRLGINNTPNDTARLNLINLVENILDPLRSEYGKPIIVNSGYRCKKLNNAVGGSSTSQHLAGEAADIESAGRSRKENEKLFNLIISLGLPFDQLVNEYNFDWVHVSFSSSRRRGQILEAKKQNGKTIYTRIK